MVAFIGCGRGDRLALQLPDAFTQPPLAIIAAQDRLVNQRQEVLGAAVLGTLEPSTVCLAVSLDVVDRVYALDLSDFTKQELSEPGCDLEVEGCCPLSPEDGCSLKVRTGRAAEASLDDLVWETVDPDEVCQ